MTQYDSQILKEKYLNLLAEKFDEEEKVATEIINLQSILDLPKRNRTFRK